MCPNTAPGALLSVNIDLLLEEVVRLNIPRLKSRLKVRKKHNIDLSPIPQLVKICRDINVDADANRVLLALEMLTRVFKEASSSPPTQATYHTAANIVKLAFELTATNVLEVVDRCAAERHNVARYTDTVRKLGQYFRATKQLVLAATSSRGSRLFRHLQVCAFQIEVPCCIREQGCSNSGTAAVQAACSPVARRNLRQRFHCSEEAIESRVKEKLDKAKPGIKVHAEIQLLFFYECYEIRQPPRLIAAIVSTFGKLNERWILPDWLLGIDSVQQRRLCQVVEQFEAVLTARCERSVNITKKLTDPIESMIALSAVWHDPATTAPLYGFDGSEGGSFLHNTTMQASIATQRQDKIYLTASELPFVMLIHHDLSELVLSMGQLRLVFDFATSLAITVCISQGDDEGNEGISFDALMIPTDSEVTVHRCAGSGDTTFRIQHGCLLPHVKGCDLGAVPPTATAQCEQLSTEAALRGTAPVGGHPRVHVAISCFKAQRAGQMETPFVRYLINTFESSKEKLHVFSQAMDNWVRLHMPPYPAPMVEGLSEAAVRTQRDLSFEFWGQPASASNTLAQELANAP
ncbi:hypothetical protein BBAD15_g6920 [Beauveria bassiana D1-5]|uniref:Uncharacterized protein n=1 Tax=Beauveria bassiana D1-5 TaxID=1245745 RepID=A0A0A2W476_BEABA|nr:hypothetical protein BBAD15_g6920 [Beauveria bassiana D1-5]